MADPFTLASVGTAASGGGSLISAIGGLMGGNSQSKAYKYQAGVARLNQQIALQNRDYALTAGETEAKRYGIGAADRMGKIRAGIGASGIDIGSGSKAAVQDSQQVVSKMDMDQIRNNAARKAYGYTVEAENAGTQAGLYDSAASDAKSSGMLKAMGSLVSGTASVADKWYQGSTAFGSGGDSGGGTDPWAGLRQGLYD